MNPNRNSREFPEGLDIIPSLIFLCSILYELFFLPSFMQLAFFYIFFFFFFKLKVHIHACNVRTIKILW